MEPLRTLFYDEKVFNLRVAKIPIDSSFFFSL